MGGASSRRSKVALLGALALVAAVVGVAVWYAAGPRSEATAPVAAATREREVQRPVDAPVAPPSVEPDRSIARDNDVAEDAPPLDDLFALLAWLEKPSHGPLPDLVGDGARFEKLFASRNRERQVAVRSLTPLGEQWSEGAVVTFEPGVWRVDAALPPSGVLPPDVTLAGSGATRTLLFLGGLKIAGRLERFTLRDCTVWTDNRPLFDAPRELVALTCERARLIGFDAGQSPSPLVRARGIGLEMRDCELLGGFGRAPGSGSLFDVPSGALLARFERCRFESVRWALDALKPNASVAFVECATTWLVDDPSTLLTTQSGIRVVDTAIDLLPQGERPAARELETLFKNWRKLLK